MCIICFNNPFFSLKLCSTLRFSNVKCSTNKIYYYYLLFENLSVSVGPHFLFHVLPKRTLFAQEVGAFKWGSEQVYVYSGNAKLHSVDLTFCTVCHCAGWVCVRQYSLILSSEMVNHHKLLSWLTLQSAWSSPLSLTSKPFSPTVSSEAMNQKTTHCL